MLTLSALNITFNFFPLNLSISSTVSDPYLSLIRFFRESGNSLKIHQLCTHHTHTHTISTSCIISSQDEKHLAYPLVNIHFFALSSADLEDQCRKTPPVGFAACARQTYFFMSGTPESANIACLDKCIMSSLLY